MFEWKKILRIKIILLFLLINVVSCLMFILQNQGVKNAVNAEKLENIYREIGGELTEERAAAIEAMKQTMDHVLAEESEIEQLYNEEKISVDDYMEYRNAYHQMNGRKEAVNLVYERYEANRETGGWMLFDAYYDRWLDPHRKHWGLALSVLLLAILLGGCEPHNLMPVLAVTHRGKYGVFREKLRVCVIASVMLTVIYGVEEMAISSFFYPLFYLDAPVQSIFCLSHVGVSVTVGQWILMMLGVRAAISALFAGVVCVLLFYKRAG